jgi:hypothetical protein
MSSWYYEAGKAHDFIRKIMKYENMIEDIIMKNNMKNNLINLPK